MLGPKAELVYIFTTKQDVDRTQEISGLKFDETFKFHSVPNFKIQLKTENTQVFFSPGVELCFMHATPFTCSCSVKY